jgi:hypothetical protein
MGPMVKDMQKQLEAARERLNYTISACQIYRIEHFLEGIRDRFSRIVIESYDSHFLVKQWTISLGGIGDDKQLSLDQKFDTKYLAEQKVEQLVTCLELEDWVNTLEANYTVYDVAKNYPADLNVKLGVDCVSTFQRNNIKFNYCNIRPMVSGVHAIVKLDPYGNIFLEPTRGGDTTVIDANEIRYFGRIEGARGFACEGIWTGTQFFITDVLFLHDTWLFDKDMITREQIFSDYLKQNKMENITRIRMRVAKISALDALFGHFTKGLIAYSCLGERIALCRGEPKLIVFGAMRANRVEFFDDRLHSLGSVEPYGGINLFYKEFYSLHIESNRDKIDLLIV